MPQCKLCQKNVLELKQSHFIPAGFYRTMTKSSGGYISVTQKTASNTEVQVKALLLCACCEQRLNKNGEHWVLNNYFKDSKFHILDNLLKIKPVCENGDDKYYDVAGNAGIDIEKIVYFAASIFWRGAVHSWKFPGSKEDPSIKLGQGYLEGLRFVLLGEESFPAKASLGVFISPKPVSDGVILPQRANRTGAHFIRHGFFVPGITFILCLGQKIPDEIKSQCAAKKKILILSRGGEKLVRELREKVL